MTQERLKLLSVSVAPRARGQPSMSRRCLLGSALCTLTLSGCLTQRLWSEDQSHAYETYKERVSSVLVSRDGKTLAIIGKDHHYLFHMPEVILKTLSSDYQKYVTASFRTFSVDPSQVITGFYSLYLAPEATQEAKTSAERAGFIEDTEGRLSVHGTLVGTRYSSGNVQIPTTSHPLMREYEIPVSAAVSSDSGRTMKLLLTPITVLADGVIVLGVVALIVLGAQGGIGVPSGSLVPR